MALIRVLGNYVLKSLFYVKKITDLILLTTSKTNSHFCQNLHIIEKV